VPAVLWVFFGSVFIGAIHDFSALIVSMRNRGYSLPQITGIYINKRAKLFFFLIGFLELWLFIAVLGLVIAIIFNLYPAAVLPVWLEVPVAIALGILIFKPRRVFVIGSIVALILLYASMVWGYYLPFQLNEVFGIPPTGMWTIILLVYAYVGSVLPVNRLLQPRDFINAHQLILIMLMLVVGILVTTFTTGLHFVSPAVDTLPAEAPSIFPFIFIIIACAAVSGFHAIVSAGTTSKQVSNEKDALMIGYGGMLTEGFLGLLVIIAVGAGIGLGVKGPENEMLHGIQAWNANYGSWTANAGLSNKIAVFVEGSANILRAAGIPREFGLVIFGVFVASFAGTSLDTSVRLQRFFFQEIATGRVPKFFLNKYMATAIVVVASALLAFATGADGKGALKLWPLFGTVNQVLAALALVVVSIYLKRKGGLKWLVTGIPALFMGVVSLWASISSQVSYAGSGDRLLSAVNAFVILLAVWVIAEGVIVFIKTQKRH
jgi:carbon starvation protein